MNMFFALYWKELRGARNTFLTLLALIFGLDVFLATRIGSAGYWSAFGFSFLPLVFLFFWGIFWPLALTRGEWKEGTAPFLWSLPVNGWQILGAKLLAAFTEWIGLNLATFVLSGLFYAAAPLCGAEWVALSELPRLNESIEFLAIVALNTAMGILLGSIICQLAYLLGRLVNRFAGLVSFGATLFLIYLTSKGSELLVPLFPGLNNIRNPFLTSDMGAFQSVSMAVFLVMLIEFVLLFLVTGWVMEKKMEF